MAGGLGFEPRQAESESAVLPLDDPPGPFRARGAARRRSKTGPEAGLIPALGGGCKPLRAEVVVSAPPRSTLRGVAQVALQFDRHGGLAAGYRVFAGTAAAKGSKRHAALQAMHSAGAASRLTRIQAMPSRVAARTARDLSPLTPPHACRRRLHARSAAPRRG